MSKEILWKVKSGLYGVCVADAAGVPVEFHSRRELRNKPVTDMIGHGTYHQPVGTWSDDSSLTLALADSLGRTGKIDPRDIMDRFLDWRLNGAYSPWGECFDIGTTTAQALARYGRGTQPALCGGDQMRDNGNGSLMRILPAAYALYPKYGADLTAWEEAMEQIHLLSSLTHRHAISQSACGVYVNIAARLLDGSPLEAAIRDGTQKALAWYRADHAFSKTVDTWKRLEDIDQFRALPERAIRSGGYVVDTLEAALWCLLNTDTYRACVLKAVNLGEDTDTTAAVAGGLAGLAYGLDGIPAAWLEQLAGEKLVESCCQHLANMWESVQVRE